MGVIDLDKLRIDGDTQARCRLDEQTVSDYAEAIHRGDVLPRVLVFHDGSDHWLAGGFHRLAAHRQAGKTSIDAEVRPGTRTDAAWAAIGDNRTNGLRMTTADKERAIKRALALRPETSNSAIAQHVGCSDTTVAKYRSELESTSQIGKLSKRQGLDGRTRGASRFSKRAATSNTATKPEAEIKELGVGTIHAHKAIDCLKNIPSDDLLRKRGFQIVSDWIKHNGGSGSTDRVKPSATSAEIDRRFDELLEYMHRPSIHFSLIEAVRQVKELQQLFKGRLPKTGKK